MTSIINAFVEQMNFRMVSDSSWFTPLEEALDGVTASMASWRSSDDFNSIWQIVNHLTFWTGFVSGRLLGELPTGKHIDNQMTFGEPGDQQTKKAGSVRYPKFIQCTVTFEVT